MPMPEENERIEPRPIAEIAARLGLSPVDVEPYGWFKGKLRSNLIPDLKQRPRGKYVLVSAINPTPLGEGKTVTSIGLSMGLNRLGHKAIVTLRQPSQGPVFGIKGGGAGGGKSTLLPFEEVNLHFTGDMHAVTAANNLLAAMVDNHLRRRRPPLLDPHGVTIRRVLDVNDASLRNIVTGLGESQQPNLLRETGFDLTAASEVMAILALATDMEDLRIRLGRMIVGYTREGDPVCADDIHCAGAMAALLKDALRPNLAQTCEHTPAMVHAGPFGNIAHGNCSVLADIAAVHLADYVVTEAGFGADLGAEKFLHIKCRVSGMHPDAVVVVCTIRALKLHSGQFAVKPGKPLPPELLSENVEALHAGAVNLEAHLDIMRQFGLPVVVAINHFPTDSDRELEALRKIALDRGATAVAVSDAFPKGGAGAEELARAVETACRQPVHFKPLYELDATPEQKIEVLATRIYGATGVDYDLQAKRKLTRIHELGLDHLPICMAKTQYSLSHDPKLIGRPRHFRFQIRDIRVSAGAGFIYPLAGEMNTMPGLSSEPAAMRIDVDPSGEIRGLR